MLRSILSIICGYVVLAILTTATMLVLLSAMGLSFEPAAADRPPPAYVIASLLVGIPCAMAGGYVAARTATRRPRTHALFLAGLVLVLGIGFSVTSTSPAHTWWYRVLLPITGAVGVVLGGWLRRDRRGHG
jgi:peptidoglycan/LPS O-acetylase OafA/YrhL